VNSYAQTAEEWFARGHEERNMWGVRHRYTSKVEIITYYKNVISYYTKAIELGCKPLYKAYVERGHFLNKIKKHEEAISDYNKVVELEPQYVEVIFNVGDIYYNLGKYQEAIEAYQKGIDKVHLKYGECAYNYQLYIAYASIGLAQHQLKKYQAACDSYTKAILCNEEYYAAYNNRGISKDALGLYEEAIADYNKAIIMYPNYAIAYNNRGISKSNVGRYEEAIQDFTKALELGIKSNAITYNNRGHAHFKAGNYKEALADGKNNNNLFPIIIKTKGNSVMLQAIFLLLLQR
jgi:tetratricopeptide (TPR) repeat protein